MAKHVQKKSRLVFILLGLVEKVLWDSSVNKRVQLSKPKANANYFEHSIENHTSSGMLAAYLFAQIFLRCNPVNWFVLLISLTAYSCIKTTVASFQHWCWSVLQSPLIHAVHFGPSNKKENTDCIPWKLWQFHEKRISYSDIFKFAHL